MGSSKWRALNGNTIVCPGTSLWRWVAGQGPRLGQAADTRPVLTSDTALPCSSTVGTVLKYETQASPMPLMDTVWSQGYFSLNRIWITILRSNPLFCDLVTLFYFIFLSWRSMDGSVLKLSGVLGCCRFVMGHSISAAFVRVSPQR